MKQRFRKSIVYMLILMFVGVQLTNAQTRGGVKGTLKDAQSGEVLMFASVSLKGTTSGTITEEDGGYELLNIKPGTYTLVFSYLSYKDIEQQLVVVAGEVQTIDGALEMESIMGEEVVITAMMRGQTAAMNQQVKSNTIVNVVSKEKIMELPDQNAAETVGRLPGVSTGKGWG